MTESETGAKPPSDANPPGQQSAVFDLSLLRGICSQAEPQQEELICTLSRRFQLVVTEVLIEETFVAHASGHCDAGIAKRIMNVLIGLQSTWMESPLELIFREFVLRQDIRAGVKLPPKKGSLFLDALRAPDSLHLEAARWLSDRRKEKDERLQARREYQETRKAHFGAKTYHFKTLLDFMERGIQQLCVEVDSPALQTRRLNRYLGRNLKSLHPDNVALIDQVFSETTFDSLDQTRFTRNYLLAEILYDLGVISTYTNAFGDVTNVLSRNPGKQINDEDDQQYVAASLMFHRLLTCDENMHLIADLFTQRGLWPGKSIHIPRGEVQRIEDYVE